MSRTAPSYQRCYGYGAGDRGSLRTLWKDHYARAHFGPFWNKRRSSENIFRGGLMSSPILGKCSRRPFYWCSWSLFYLSKWSSEKRLHFAPFSFNTPLRACFYGLTHVQSLLWKVLVKTSPLIGLIIGLSYLSKQRVRKTRFFVCYFYNNVLL